MSANEIKRPEYFYGAKLNESNAQSHATRTAESECQYMLPLLHETVTSNPTLKLLDVGCGPGSITISLARYFPDGHATGVDLSDEVLEKARTAAKDLGVANVTFQSADVYALPFADESFDVVHTSQAVAHFHQHVDAIKELKRVVKKGGLLCMREVDLYNIRFYPDWPVLSESLQGMIKLHERKGAYADAGRRLKAWTVEAGVPRENITYTAGTSTYSTPKQKQGFNGMRIYSGAVADGAVEHGFATR